MKVCFPRSHEGSAFGPALLGMEALGVIESFAVAADLLPVFADLYDVLGPAFRALQRLQR